MSDEEKGALSIRWSIKINLRRKKETEKVAKGRIVYPLILFTYFKSYISGIINRGRY